MAPPQLVTNAISWALAMGNERCWHIAYIVPTKSSNDFARDSVLTVLTVTLTLAGSLEAIAVVQGQPAGAGFLNPHLFGS